MGLKVNTETIEEPISLGGGGDNFEFPPVAYQAQIDKTEVRNKPAWADDVREFAQSLQQTRDRGKNPGIQSDGDVEFVSVQLGSIDPLEDVDVEVGNRKFFVPENPNSDGLVIRDGNLSIEKENFDPDADDVEYYRLQSGADYIARLANALGQVSGGEVRDGFVEDLIDGKFDGMQVGFEVAHGRTYTNKNDEEITTQRIVQFFPV